MEKGSWKREPGSAHVSGKMEGVSQALPQPRALGDFRTHCHHSSLSPLPPAILELFFLELFSTTATFFFWSSRSQQALAVFAPSGHALSALAHHRAPSPPWSTDPFTAPLCFWLPFFNLPFLPLCLPCTEFSPSILFSLTQILLYVSPGKIKDSLSK